MWWSINRERRRFGALRFRSNGSGSTGWSNEETEDIWEMFGNNPNLSVTTELFGFGEAFGRARGCERESMAVQRDKVVKQEGNENPVGLETDNEDKGDTTTTNRCKFYENMQMQCA